MKKWLLIAVLLAVVIAAASAALPPLHSLGSGAVLR